MKRKTSGRMAVLLAVLVVASVFSPLFIGSVMAQEDGGTDTPTTTPGEEAQGDDQEDTGGEETEENTNSGDESEGDRPDWLDEYAEPVQTDLIELVEDDPNLSWDAEHLPEVADRWQEEHERQQAQQEQEEQGEDLPGGPNVEDAEDAGDDAPRKVIGEMDRTTWVSDVSWGENSVEITVIAEEPTLVGVYDSNRLNADEPTPIQPFRVQEGANVITIDNLKEDSGDLTVVIQTGSLSGTMVPLSNPEEPFLESVKITHIPVAAGAGGLSSVLGMLIIAWSRVRKTNKDWTEQ